MVVVLLLLLVSSRTCGRWAASKHHLMLLCEPSCFKGAWAVLHERRRSAESFRFVRSAHARLAAVVSSTDCVLRLLCSLWRTLEGAPRRYQCNGEQARPTGP